MQDLEVYPFWKMSSTQRLVVRFIPDLNEHNINGFIDEYDFHTVTINDKQTLALCSRRHEDNKKCYHCMIARRGFDKNDGWHDSDARRYWRRQRYVGNVIIIEDPLGVTDPDNPKTYRLGFGKQIFNDLKEDLLNGKLEEMPTDYYKGYNFAITREEHQAPYPKYAGAFHRKSKLTTRQIELAERSLLDLSELRPTLYTSNCQDDLSKDLCWEILGDV